MREATYKIHGKIIGLGALALIAGICFSGASPAIPGLDATHPLDEAQIGRLLITELRCASCHEGVSQDAPLAAPDLSSLGSRLNADFTRNFIASPTTHDPGTTMPDVIANRTEEERRGIANSITAFLFSLSKSPAIAHAAAPEIDKGSEIYHEMGCVACHSPLDKPGVADRPGAVGLGHVAAKYQQVGLADFLQDPLKVRPDGRMPDMKLSRTEAELLAAFLTKDAAPSDASELDVEKIGAGKKAFAELRCNSCHDLDEIKPSIPPAKQFALLDLAAGCLSEQPGVAPDYQLNKIQKSAIRKALATKPVIREPADEIKVRLTALNCISCHQRSDYGGVSPELDSYFHTTEEALGNEARIPPSLTDIGWKLRPEWMNKVLYEAERVRPYMKTRMPQYGEQALEGLPGYLHSVDAREPFDFPPIADDKQKEMREGATLLLGDKGLNCIACHNYNGKDSPGMKGLDIMTSYQRLQPGWFDQFMRNPGKFRPGIIMPTFWPDGKAIQTEILGGDADAQIAALWDNFSLGRSARNPSGLRVEEPELTVRETSVTYRGRSTVAGYRGIAVGFPGGMNYAFNAQTGALSAIWKGKFVKVGWIGQGSGNFTPLGNVIQLPQDVAFLQEPIEPWPLAPQRTKEHPVNPDPLYPRQHGYAFQGYSISENGIPTFRYTCGEIEITDTAYSVSENSRTSLRRTLTFKTESATTIHLRPLAGDVSSESKKVFKTVDLKLTFTGETALLRPAAGGGQELLIKLVLPEGRSTTTIDYELLH